MNKILTGITKAGTVINFTSGAYSDYSSHGIYVACVDFNYIDEAKKFWDSLSDLTKNTMSYSDDTFILYLIKKELIVNTTSIEIHIGSYGFDLHDN